MNNPTTEKWWAMVEQSGIGSHIDQRSDAVFVSLLYQADIVEAAVRSALASELSRFRVVQGLLIASCVGLAVLVGFVLLRSERQRELDFVAQGESKREFQDTLMNLMEGFYRVTPDGKLLSHNAEFARILGLDPKKDHAGIELPDFWQDLEDRNKYIEELTRDGFIKNYLVHAKKSDGGKIVVLVNSRLMRNEMGKPSRIEGTFLDITERKELQDELKSFYLVSAELMCVASPSEGRFTKVNPACLKMLGRSPEEMSSRPFEDFIHPDDREPTKKVVVSQLRGNPVANFENRYQHKDGSYRWISWMATMAIDGQVYAMGRDITERKQSEHEFRNLAAELESRVAERTSDLEQRISEVERLNRGMLNLADDLQVANADLEAAGRLLEIANQELEAFAYSVSHDLRAPLRHISGFVDILGDNSADALDESGQRHLRLIAESAGRMGTLIDDLLEFSRAGRMELHVGTLDLGRLTDEVLQEVQARAEEREIVWQVDALPEVMADRATMRQVLVNLVENAVKYTRKTPSARIEIGTAPDDGKEMVVFVRDNGVGFDPRYAHKLFGVFQRLHRVEEFEGTGIGLANVRRIISRHGGRTWAEGKVGEGATFFFSLPRKEE